MKLLNKLNVFTIVLLILIIILPINNIQNTDQLFLKSESNIRHSLSSNTLHSSEIGVSDIDSTLSYSLAEYNQEINNEFERRSSLHQISSQTTISEEKYQVNPSMISLNPVEASAFVSKWNTTLTSTGSSSNNQVKLPLESTGTYNFTINWGDGNNDIITDYSQAEVTHTYSSSGLYTIIIAGIFNGWRFNNGGDKLKLIEISQWGNLNLGNSQSYFYGASNLELTANDAPDLTNTTTLNQAFRGATNLGSNGNMNLWNVSSVTNTDFMFYESSSFNQPIGNWDVSSVISMRNMFSYTFSFNQDISNWNVSSGTHMGWMFSYTYSFNQPIGNWDVSSVTNMAKMFYYSTTFNQPIGNWDVSSVTNMMDMFFEASAFNQSLNNWNTSSVTLMQGMFFSAKSFNQPIGNWDVSSVTNIKDMFKFASSFNQPIGNWNVSSVTNIIWIFSYATSFNQDINNWNVSGVTEMHYMFYNAKSFNQPIGNWDVSGVTDMHFMFAYASSFNQPVNNWDVSGVIDMNSMFKQSSSFNQPLNNWNVSNTTNMSGMFSNAESFNQDINNWDVSSVTNVYRMFSEAKSFNQPIGNWNISSVTNMVLMFYKSYSFNQPLNTWNISGVTEMHSMFFEAISFNQPLNNWDVSSVTDMAGIFNNATSFNQPLNNWDVSIVTNMVEMFYKATSFNQSLNDWNVSSVTGMTSMFNQANSFDQDVSSWDVSNVTDMDYMFNGVTLSFTNYDNLLLAWSLLALKSGVNFHAGNSRYSNAAVSARQLLIDNFGWIITDGGKYELIPPYISNPDDINYLKGSTGNIISWVVGDNNPDFYNITKDGIIYSTKSWVNGTIEINIDGLPVGSYEFILTVYDIIGNSATDTVNVTVYEIFDPVVSSPSDMKYEVDSTGNIIEWTLGSQYPNNYIVTKDDSEYSSNTWTNGTVSINIDGLPVGSYEFIIQVYDTYGNMVFDAVIVIVFAKQTIEETFTDDSFINGFELLLVLVSAFTIGIISKRKYEMI